MSDNADNTPTVQDTVNSLVGAMVQNDSGKWELPAEKAEGVSPELLIAVNAERRFRDTQSSYTKAQQRAKELETINNKMTSHLIDNATMHLSQEQKDELASLRVTDPEAWRTKLNEHEANAKQLQQTKIEEFTQAGKTASELAQREQAYTEFKTRTGIELNDTVIADSLPASYQKRLEDGRWNFGTFLAEAEKFLRPPTAIKGAGEGEQATPNLGALAGGSEPSPQAQDADIVQDYENTIF